MVRIISGSIIIARVITPAIMENPQPKEILNIRYPNRPNTMDGMPESVSVVTRIIFTSLLPRLAYSTRYTAAKTPIGTAITRVSAVMIRVFIIAGIMLTFSVV